MPFAATISLVASAALLVAYGPLNTGKLTPDDYAYQWLNAIGAAALTYSVIKPFNVGVFIIEALWTLIALYGVFKIWRARRAKEGK